MNKSVVVASSASARKLLAPCPHSEKLVYMSFRGCTPYSLNLVAMGRAPPLANCTSVRARTC